jgi:hypothetical protein
MCAEVYRSVLCLPQLLERQMQADNETHDLKQSLAAAQLAAEELRRM